MTVIDLEEQRRKGRERAAKHYDKQRVATESGNKAQCRVCGDVFYTPYKKVLVCGEGGCAKQLKRARLKPFTLPHFRKWAAGVILDNDKPWKLEWFHEVYLEDIFAGNPITWLLIGEGNTKTTTLAGLGLYHIQFKRYGRVPVAASSRDQAFEMYLQAQGMIERSEETLGPIFEVHEGQRQIKCPSMASRMQIYAADDRTGDGAIFTLALVDEGHRHRDLKLYRTWVGKIPKRGGQLGLISTAGAPGEEFETARTKIRQTSTSQTKHGEDHPGYTRYVNGPVILHEHTVPETGDVEDMAVVKMANPFSAITLESLQVKRNDPTTILDHWKRFTCNLATRGGSAAITELEWFRQKADSEVPEGLPIYAGLDVAWKWDTTALVGLWVRDTEWYQALPAVILEPPRDETSLNPDLVEDALITMHNRNPIHTLVMDTNKAEQLAEWARNNLGCEVIDRAQSNSFQVKDYEKVTEGLRNGTLWHAGDSGLATHALNAIAKVLPGGQVRFDRPRTRQAPGQERRVIDALTALGMATTIAVAEANYDSGVMYA